MWKRYSCLNFQPWIVLLWNGVMTPFMFFSLWSWPITGLDLDVVSLFNKGLESSLARWSINFLWYDLIMFGNVVEKNTLIVNMYSYRSKWCCGLSMHWLMYAGVKNYELHCEHDPLKLSFDTWDNLCQKFPFYFRFYVFRLLILHSVRVMI